MRDENQDDSIYEDSQAETSFSNIQQEATEAELRLRERNLEKEETGKSTPSSGDSTLKYHPEERVRFRLSSSGYLQSGKIAGRIREYHKIQR